MGQLWRWAQRFWQNRLCRVAIASAISVAAGVGADRVFIGSVFVVEGASMEPAYLPGMSLYGAPVSTPLERGDVVLLNDSTGDYVIKRIVGLPGETIQLWRGRVFVNRRLLVEPYLPKHTYTYPEERTHRGAVFALGESEYFVLGDNRLCSADSRTYGPVDRSQIKRRVALPDGFVCAYLAPYTLPAYGQTIIRPLEPHVADGNTAR